MKLLNVCSASSILIAALLAVRAEAHNGAVALAYPVEGITVDGDSNWPEEEGERHLTELERFYRLAVGREKRVIGLKREVNELLENQGRESRYRIDE